MSNSYNIVGAIDATFKIRFGDRKATLLTLKCGRQSSSDVSLNGYSLVINTNCILL